MKMEKRLRSIIDIHGKIGKFLKICCISLLIAGLLGIIFGISKFHKDDVVTQKNYFINENVVLHEKFNIIVNEAKTLSTISILDKKGNVVEKNGTFISINLSITNISNEENSIHKLDSNDFKLKDHTGIYLPLNEIASILDWNMMDVRYDPNGEVVTSSANFNTKKALKDYSYIDMNIDDKTNTIIIYFEMSEGYHVESNLMVLEIDFFIGSNKNKLGCDIILLNRPTN